MPENQKVKVLITGANGFVGSRLCRRLLNDGYNVVAGIRDGCEVSLIEELNLEYRFGDVTDTDSLRKMVRGVDYIVHNAGVVKASDPNIFFKINRDGVRNIIEAAMLEPDLKKFILISSLSAAGPSQYGEPRTEDMPAEPMTAYGRSKLEGEKEVLKHTDKINSVILRPSGVYGPGDKEMLAFFQALNNRIKPYLGNLKRRIQLVHADDLAFAVSCALKSETESGSIYFVAESNSYSYYQLVRHLRRAVGRAGLPIYLPAWLLKAVAGMSERVMKMLGKTPMFTVEKAGEILVNWEVSVARAEKELGFKSQVDFPDGAVQTVQWYREEGWL